MNRQKQGAGQEPVRPAGGRDSLYVTSSASFWNANSGERPGVRLPFRGEFQWGGSRWVVPGVYSTEKALVVDLCRQVDPDSVKRFLKQWGWTPEIGKNDTRDFTPAEAARIEAENPLSFSFRGEARIDGEEVPMGRSSGVEYLSFLPEEGEEALAAVRCYDLNPAQCWNIWRCAFPWSCPRQMEELSLCLEAEAPGLPGEPFQVRAGERVELTHPQTGERCVLTAQELAPDTLKDPGFLESWESPTHLWRLAYTLEPDLEGFALRDTEEGDLMRPKPVEGSSWGFIGGEDGPSALLATAPEEEQAPQAASIGIIGGACSVAVIQVKDTPQEETAATAVMKGEDGPAAVLVGLQSQSQGERSTRVALSALRFELAETVTWLPVFSGAVPEALAVKLEKQGSP